MAITKIQNGSVTAAGGVTTRTSVFSTNPTIGNTIVVQTVEWLNTVGATFTPTVTDNKGNTYTKRSSGVVSVTGVGDFRCEIWSAPVTATGASFTVTASYTTNATQEDMVCQAVECSPLTFDQQATNQSTTAGNVTATTGTLASATSIAFATCNAAGSAVGSPATSGYTNISADTTGVVQGYTFDYQITSATTPLSATWAFSGGGGSGIIAVFSDASAGAGSVGTAAATSAANAVGTGPGVGAATAVAIANAVGSQTSGGLFDPAIFDGAIFDTGVASATGAGAASATSSASATSAAITASAGSSTATGAASGTGARSAAATGTASASASAAGVGSTASGGTAWNPARKGASVTLSNGNLTATQGATSYESTFSVDPITGSQKVYFEVVCNVSGSTSGFGVGIGNSSASTATYLGSDNNSIVYYCDGFLFIGNSVGPTMPSYGAGDVIGVAVDMAADKIWFRKNGGSWNNSGTDDPATNSGGYSLSGVVTGTRYAGLEMDIIGNQGTARFSSASWTLGAPSGFAEISTGSAGTATAAAAASAIGASLAAAAGSAGAAATGSAVGARTTAAAGGSTAAATASATGASLSASAGAAAASGASTGIGSALAAAAGSATATSSASASAGGSGSATGTAVASASASAVSAALSAAAGSSAGTAAATGVGGALAPAAGASTASGAASGVGASSAAAVGSATANASASATSSSGTLATGVGSASAAGSATGTGTSSAAATGAATASSSASATGSALAGGAGAAAATASGLATGAATAASAGSGTAQSAASATGAAIARAVGSGQAIGNALGASFIQATIGTGAATAKATAAAVGSFYWVTYDPTYYTLKAVRAALLADPVIAGYVGTRIYERPPQQALTPYIVLGATTSGDFSTADTDGEDVLIEIHCWEEPDTQSPNTRLPREIVKRIREVLHFASLTLDAPNHPVMAQVVSGTGPAIVDTGLLSTVSLRALVDRT